MTSNMESVEARDYFTHVPPPTTKPQPRPSVSFHSPAAAQRPHPKSRLSTHRLDSSSTNFAKVLHDDGGPNGLRNLDIDYFNTVIDVFRDRKQHHSPTVFDFMLLHEINIHRIEHLLLAEWDWLSTALSNEDEEEDTRRQRAEQAPRRLDEIQRLLDQYSSALRNFEEMRKRDTLDEASVPLSTSSWHERLLHIEQQVLRKSPGRPPSLLRRISNVIQMATISKDDPEKFQRPEIHVEGAEGKSGDDKPAKKTRNLFGAASPACRRLAGVEDWQREYEYRELTAQQKAKAVRDEKIATRFRRFSFAFFAGISLIGPMLLMSLVGSLKCSLATTSSATLLFAMLVTYLTSINERDIVVIIAGYAAVLVVFVGSQHP